MMKRKDYFTLLAIGAILGAIAGALASAIENEGKDMTLWSVIGAMTLSSTAAISKGRILSFLFLDFDPGSPYEGHRKGEWKLFWIVLGFWGLFLGSLQFEWMDQISDWMLYVTFPVTAIACFSIGYFMYEKLKEFGTLVFGLIGLTWGIYSYFSDLG
jgi:hypothetical protein